MEIAQLDMFADLEPTPVPIVPAGHYVVNAWMKTPAYGRAAGIPTLCVIQHDGCTYKPCKIYLRNEYYVGDNGRGHPVIRRRSATDDNWWCAYGAVEYGYATLAPDNAGSHWGGK